MGKTALVTGGSRGIGAAISIALKEAGYTVAASYAGNDDAAGKFKDETGIPVYKWDVSDYDSCVEGIAKVEADLGPIDILVNNAGIADARPMKEFDDDSYERLMSTNLSSVFRACRSVLPHMQAQGGGVILNMGSISAIISNIPQQQVAYNASKAAVHQLTKSLASDHAIDNIRVNAIAPGYIITEMTEGGMKNPEMAPIWQNMTPMERAGEVDEIASAALIFCTDASSYCTGSVLVIDGGYTTR